MKKISEFIVSKRYWILGVMLCLSAICAIASQSVSVNYDMTKYLPDDSSMKKGMDIMSEEFSDTETAKTIRVMAEGLDEGQKSELLRKLEAIPNVDSVAHDDSEEYNKDAYTLYVLSTTFAYTSPEEAAIEDSLANDFNEYHIVFRNDDIGNYDVSLLLVGAVALLLVILFAMCESWIEPILFLFTIGLAVIINSGTNIFLGEISSVTSSISAILQLVLSMDYSIILLSRYRQEKALGLSKTEAMAAALHNAFTSVTSSAMTTVVGLLTLAFMNFKIGADLGIVLAKGVFISLVCVLTILPALIIMFDRLIFKTAKKAPHISMNAIARFSYKFRYVLSGFFVLLFVGLYILQGNTQTVYTLAEEDPIADIFPPENMLVLVYSNEDEDKAADLADSLEKTDGVKQVMGYPNLLGKSYTAEEFADAIDSMGSSMGAEIGDGIDLDPALLKLIYYHYYDGTTSSLTMEEFLSFLSDDVLNNDTFADAIDEDMRKQADKLAVFSDADNLTSAKSTAALADSIDMDEETVKDLLLYYYTQYGGVDTGTMTLPVFASFVVDEVAADPDYRSLFDAGTLSELTQLKTFTNIYNIITPFRYTKIANLLGIDADTAELLFVYYYAQSKGYEPGTMTLPAFVNFLQTKVMNDPTFSSYLDESTKAQINTLSQFTDKAALQKQRTPAELAQMLGMDKSMVELLFTLHNAQDVSGKTMTLPQFTAFLNDHVLDDPMFAGSFDDATKAQLRSMNSMVQLAASGQTLTPAQMAGVLGMEEAAITQLYFLYLSSSDAAFQQEMAAMTMTLEDFVTLAESQATGEQLTQLTQMEQIINAAASEKALPAAQLAGITGIDEGSVTMLFGVQSQASGTEVTAMTLQDFVALALSMQSDNAQLQQLSQIVDLTVSGNKIGAAALAQIFGMEPTQVQQMFGLTLAAQKTISLPVFTAFLVNNVITNDAYAGNFSAEQTAQLTMLNQMAQLAASGRALDTAALAQAFGMDESMVTMLFRLHYGGDITGKTMSMEEMVDFILKDPAMADFVDSETMTQLKTMQGLIHATVSDTAFTCSQLASVLGMDSSMMKMLFTYHDAVTGAANNWKLSLRTVVNFILNNKNTFSSMMGSGDMNQLSMLQRIMNGTINGTSYTASRLADLLGMDSSQMEQLYLLYIRRHGDTSAWKMSVQQLVNFLNSDVLTNADFSDLLDKDSKEMLTGAKAMVDAVISGQKYTAAQAQNVLSALTEELDSNTVELLYFYYAAENNYNSAWTLSINQFFNYLHDSVLNDVRFRTFIDEEMKSSIEDMSDTLNDGIEMLKTDAYSRMTISTTLPVESSETTAFMAELTAACDSFENEYYLIGNSAMSYEMQQTFDKEMLLITVLTALAIFLIVLISFRSFIIPVLLVLIVQCGVYITVAITGLQGYSIYFLALLIVECILMGATIDYGILFTNYYRDHRKNLSILDALKAAYNGSIHTIMTSGLIIVLVTGIIGYTHSDPTIAQICRTIAIGALSAILLILFILPSLLSLFDKFIVRKKKLGEEKSSNQTINNLSSQ